VNRQLRGIVRRNVLDGRERVAARDLDLPHVADVEQPRARPDGQVLVTDAGVLNRHVPAAEFNHPGTKRSMARVEGSFLERAGRGQSHQQWIDPDKCGGGDRGASRS
jgi:hypothetical protein